MWEAVAAPGREDDLAGWALALGVGDVYRSADGRVVVVAEGVDALPDPPEGSCAREPHAWPFERVAPNHGGLPGI
ncbi:MAG TPA: hypothetical protein VGX28_05180 [Frankiaceae bacterium]|jgi:hypothetical protein|nr:hypothetical protein [Frankiaceae bacterium]